MADATNNRPLADATGNAVYAFEDVGDDLSLLPLAARRALDVAGLRLSLDGYQSLPVSARRELARAGVADAVDGSLVERVVRGSSTPATRIKPVADPDPVNPPEQLHAALGARRAVEPATWARLRALDRYALIHVMRRSIAHDDPSRLEAAVEELLTPRRRGGSDAPRPEPRTDAQARELHRSDKPARAVPTVPSASSHASDIEVREASIPALRADFMFEERSTAPPPSEYPARAEHAPRTERRRSSAPPPASMQQQQQQLSSHLSEAGEVRMVGIAGKDVTVRRATASGQVRMRPDTAHRLVRNETPKGEVLAAARIAGIMAAKRTPDLIPLCHQVALTSVEIVADIEVSTGILALTAVAEAVDRTGVEMEALTAISVACLTVYDMLKGIDREIVISEIKLVSKTGGKTGHHDRRDG